MSDLANHKTIHKQAEKIDYDLDLSGVKKHMP